MSFSLNAARKADELSFARLLFGPVRFLVSSPSTSFDTWLFRSQVRTKLLPQPASELNSYGKQNMRAALVPASSAPWSFRLTAAKPD